jgi:hypothetical protein
VPRAHGATPTDELLACSLFTVPRAYQDRLEDYGRLIDAIVEADPGAACLDCCDEGYLATGGRCRCPRGEEQP